MTILSVKDCLSAGWTAFKARPWLFIGASAIIMLANMLISGVQSALQAGGAAIMGPNSMLVMLVAAIAAMALSFLVGMGKTWFYLRAHDSVSTAGLWHLWQPYPYLKFVGTSLLLGIMVLVGLVLLIVPGLILGIIFGFALYAVMEDDLSPIDALKRSAAITKGNRWRMFLLGLAILGINIVGALLLIVGLLVTLPVSALAVVHAYRVLSKGQQGGEVIPAA